MAENPEFTVRSSTYNLLHRAVLLSACIILLSKSGSGSELKGVSTRVTATLDTNQIRIGEQFKIRLRAITESGTAVRFPVVPDTLNGLEIVERGKIDTLKAGNGMPDTLRQELTVTGFDSGYYVVEPFIFVVNRTDGKIDSLTTEAQLLSVRTIPVDTTKAIKDIKPVMDPPFDWTELLPWLWVLLGTAAATFIAYRLYRRYRLRDRSVTEIRKPSRPAHEIALEAIEKLEAEKLWQQGYHKEYHIRLTDIVRTYIDHRFDVASQESTTDETLQLLHRLRIDGQQHSDLERLLRLADMVKFAKAIPIINENEQSIRDARSFILATATHQQQEAQS
ncbi:MAG: hypothetical protein RL021_1518 [Bacteroidota bacterium]